MPLLPTRVAEAFVDGKRARQGNLVSSGDEIRSYAMRLAHKDPDGTVVLDYIPRSEGGPGNTVTTNRHMHALEVVLSQRGTPNRRAAGLAGG